MLHDTNMCNKRVFLIFVLHSFYFISWFFIVHECNWVLLNHEKRSCKVMGGSNYGLRLVTVVVARFTWTLLKGSLLCCTKSTQKCNNYQRGVIIVKLTFIRFVIICKFGSLVVLAYLLLQLLYLLSKAFQFSWERTTLSKP